jgi:hypothetical protein
MIRKELMAKPRDAFYWVENILAENKDYYLNKEEIYARIPTDEEGVSIVTIASLENAIRNLARVRIINIEYHHGKRYFGYNDKREEWR